MRGIIDMTTIVLHTVGNNKVGDTHHNVITRNLVEYTLAELNGWSLIFDNHAWLGTKVVKYCVATFRGAVEGEGDFVLQLFLGVALVLRQKVYKMLAHPFLWRKSNVAMTQRVEHGGVAVVLGKPKWGRG